MPDKLKLSTIMPRKKYYWQSMAILIIFCYIIFGSSIVGSSEKEYRGKEIKNFYKEYDALIKSLQQNGFEVSGAYNESVTKFLKSEKAISLVGFTPEKGGSWSFYQIVYLRKDLMFVSYDDGEMYGGNLLVKITSSNNQIISMKTVWNSAK